MLSRRESVGLVAGGLIAAVAWPAAATPSLPSPPTWPGAGWAPLAPLSAGFDPVLLAKAVARAASKGGAGMVVRSGWLVAQWGVPAQRYLVYSATKGFGGILLGLALGDGRVLIGNSALARLREFGVPPTRNRRTGWLPLITLQHLLSHEAGFDKPGGFTRLLFPPGTYTFYSDGGANWLADVLTVTFGADLWQVLVRRVLAPIGVLPGELTWRKNKYRPATLRGLPRREFGSGIYIGASAFARVGLLLLRKGFWRAAKVLPDIYVDQAFAGRPDLPPVPDWKTRVLTDRQHYWMYLHDNGGLVCPSLPPDAFWFWGKYDNHLLVVPSLDLIVVRLGTSGFGDEYAAVDGLFAGFVRALGYAPSPPPPPTAFRPAQPL